MPEEVEDFSSTVIVNKSGVVVKGEQLHLPEELKSSISHVLVSSGAIQNRIKALAYTIADDYSDVHAVVVLKGAIIFFSDLSRALFQERLLVINYDVMKASSYQDTESTGKINIELDVGNVEGKDLLVIEDIMDTGLTLSCIKKHLIKDKKAKSVKLCVLFDKPERRKVDIKAEYVGFKIPDYFVVGYGLDFNQQFRNLPFLGVLREDFYKGE